MNEAQEEIVCTWFYEKKGRREGPITEDEMVQLVQTGVLSHGAAVWKTGFPSWLKIEETNLNQYLDHSIPPPLIGESINNTLVWILAFAPILGVFLEYFVAGIQYGDNTWAINIAMHNNKYWFMTVALNIILAYFDEKKLNQAGHNTDKFKGWIWIVPVYLYQRAKATKQNLAYFIVWIVCFVLIMFN